MNHLADPRSIGASAVSRWDAREVTGRYARRITGIVVFFLTAECVTRMDIVPSIYLPRASWVLFRALALLHEPHFLFAVGATLGAWAIGLAVAGALGVALGILIGSSALAYRMVSPLIEFFRPIPSVAIIPLAIILWGQGPAMKIILVAYASLWPILYNTIYGVHDLDPVAMDTGRSFGLGGFALLRRIAIPSAAPFAFTGLRISASIGLIVVVGTELLASADSGIGSFILFASSNGGQMDSVLAAAAIAGLVGVTINSILGLIDRRLFGWRYLGRDAR